MMFNILERTLKENKFVRLKRTETPKETYFTVETKTRLGKLNPFHVIQNMEFYNSIKTAEKDYKHRTGFYTKLKKVA